jgi:hypothetical protein
MTASLNTFGNQTFALQNALSAYSDEMYTAARRLSSTGIVGSTGMIDTSTETYVGQMRWFKPTESVVNTARLDDAQNGGVSSFNSALATYIKRVGTYGHSQVNMTQVVAQKDGLAKIAADFGEVKANDEHSAVLSTLVGVAKSEASYGAGSVADAVTGGITGFDSVSATPANSVQEHDASSIVTSGSAGTGSLAATTGFYVDVNAAGEFGAVEGTDRGLVQDRGSDGLEGAARAERLFQAVGMGFADYEPDFMYLVASPEIYSQLRSSNLVDQSTVTEGNIEFQTIFGGKFRLIMTRASQGNPTAYGAAGAVTDASTKTSFLVKPGSVAMASLNVPMPVEIDRSARSYHGGGSTDVFYRWGYIAHAMGYSWGGAADHFADLSDLGGANWRREMDVLNLGILPIFHA